MKSKIMALMVGMAVLVFSVVSCDSNCPYLDPSVNVRQAKMESNHFKLTDNGKSLLFEDKGNSVLQYNYDVVEGPKGVDEIFARSGYIHPVWSVKGKRVTNDFPKKHFHHHGIWFPWTNTTFDGKRTDFWNSKAGQGKVRFVKMVKQGSGVGGVSGRGGRVGVAYFSALQNHIATNRDDKKPVVVLNERWDVKIYQNETYRIFDFVSTQACATDKALKLNKYHYGGLGFRGSGQWEGEGDACYYLTSEGKTRKDGHGTRSRWCAIYQKVDGEVAGVVIMCHPSNFRYPQPMRIHPSEPFFCYAPEALGDFEIRPGKPYVSKYRFVVFDGEPNKDKIEKLWEDYANSSTVTLIK